MIKAIPDSLVAETKAQIDAVIAYSQEIDEPMTEEIMKKWQINKSHYFMKFGGQLIYEYPEKVSFELSDEEKSRALKYFIDDLYLKYGPHMVAALCEFLEDQNMAFFNNLTVKDYITPAGKEIRKGTKLIKSFKHFVNNEKILAEIQNKASMVIQENKIEGKLCLSIHPMDYLTISENNYNWRSCHSMDGDYRAGNLSYMMDRATVVCYLKSEEDARLYCMPMDMKWNSKKWRVLLYVSNDMGMIFAGKQYPFETKTGMNFVLEKLLPNCLIQGYGNGDMYSWSPWCKVIDTKMPIIDASTGESIGTYASGPMVPVGSKNLMPLRSLINDAKGSKHFNDVIFSSCYKPIYAFRKFDVYFREDKDDVVPATYMNDTAFSIGEETKCLRCGNDEIVGGGGTMMCYECEEQYGNTDNEDFTFCACCDRHIYVDDAYYVQGDYLCENCVDTETSTCDFCGEIMYKENVRYYEEFEEWLCDDCYSHKLYTMKNKGE